MRPAGQILCVIGITIDDMNTTGVPSRLVRKVSRGTRAEWLEDHARLVKQACRDHEAR